VSYAGQLYAPVVQDVPEETLGGFLPPLQITATRLSLMKIKRQRRGLVGHPIPLQLHTIQYNGRPSRAAQRRKKLG